MIYIEYGLDFDNNKYGFGKSTEIENPDGSEYRTKEKIKLKHKSYYVRIWILKTVIVISSTGIHLTHKKRYNLKLIFGICGEKKNFKNF